MKLYGTIKRFGMPALLSAALSIGALSGTACLSVACAAETNTGSSAASSAPSAQMEAFSQPPDQSRTSATGATSTAVAATSAASGPMIDASTLFTDRDNEQTADTTGATAITVSDGEDVTISEEGVYVISGTASECTITVDADSAAKVQLALNGVSISNSNAPALFVASADKVFVTTAENTENTLEVTGTFATTADDNFDGVIYAKDDVVLNGKGTLTINSSDNGIVGKDDIKITGGTYAITAVGHAIEGKDSVVIADGTFQLNAGTDGIHVENADDATLGYVYIGGGSFSIDAGSDGIEAATVVQVDGGSMTMNASEGIEGTYVQINDGTIDIQASDDGINATTNSTAFSVALEINGGDISLNMAQGDTDALDSNGALFITGGTVNITAQSAFDFDGTGSMTGGTVYVNGTQITELTNSMMGGMGGMGAPQGNMGGMGSGPMGGPRGGMK